jgi:ribosome biogenesis protein Nip4
MKPVNCFSLQVGANALFRKDQVVKQHDRYFLLNENVKKVMRRDFFYAGIYLGKSKGPKFFPSFDYLDLLSRKKSNKVIVDSKTAWLFICGRDIFRKGILSYEGSTKKGVHTLVLNEYKECLGFGRIIRPLDDAKEGLAVKRISDIGDFLRREDR